MSGLTAFDVVVLIMVVLAAMGGLARGFVGEVVSLLAWAAGIIAVRMFYVPVNALTARLGFIVEGGQILAFVICFLGAFIIVRIIGGRLSQGTKASIVGPVDRLLGLGFGAAKGVLGAALLFLMLNLTFDTIDPGEPSPIWLKEARTAPTLAMVAKAMTDFVAERRRVPHDSAAVDAGAAPRQGYDRDQRSALDKLLGEQEKKSPATPI